MIGEYGYVRSNNLYDFTFTNTLSNHFFFKKMITNGFSLRVDQKKNTNQQRLGIHNL